MLNLLTGEAKTRLASWSEDQFRQAFIESKRQFLKLLFRETKAISSTEVMVTYGPPLFSTNLREMEPKSPSGKSPVS